MKELKDKEVFLSAVIFAEFVIMYKMMASFWFIFAAMVLTIFFGVANILGIKPRLSNILKNGRFFILPICYFLGMIFFLTIVQSKFIQFPLIIAYAVSCIPLFKSLKKLKTSRSKPLVISRNIVSMISLVTVFLLISDIVNASLFFKLPVYITMISVFFFTWIMTYFLYWQYRDTDRESLIYINLISLVMMEIVWAGSFWVTSYPSAQIGSLGVPVIAMVALVAYYSFWGIAHHKLEQNLTKKVLLEYIMISVIIVVIILFTTNWVPEGII